ncbi:NAD-dependent epimerase/dehydratase family protein [Pseudodonghicola flavimaris]|uniref:NAD-dependent epimerase/dehydratase family protein n=1 Tax=Pseudodonghicola flavimaris TaxID=3050036 RepID=A0ABT7F852_9RHOB|nr:NAD-dependent epimerase/dehydratase family protein [Pseudodonghicola flavimaris]MDK3020797.1 NAD-dependent epimerase/dehydratase family protein [Pseudodonghicola flavimaris]
MRSALVTGSAGFIGYHLSARLLSEGWRVTGLDCLSDYYDVELKKRRHALLAPDPNFTPVIGRLEDPGRLQALFQDNRFDLVIHLAAQAGVRHSIDAPRDYVEANLIGTFELLEAARAHPPMHLLLASTSSVYGANTEMPYGERDKADTQMSFYAATKKATEAMAHSYAHLYRLPTTMFRFFTVYGPWGRPDMAHFKFTRAILEGRPIDVYNHGQMQRDFTYIDDLVDGILGLTEAVPGDAPVSEADSLSPVAPFRVVNIGGSRPTKLLDYIAAIEAACGRDAEKVMHPMQPGDVPATWADTRLLTDLTGYAPKVPVGEGIQRFVDWYRDYYGI